MVHLQVLNGVETSEFASSPQWCHLTYLHLFSLHCVPWFKIAVSATCSVLSRLESHVCLLDCISLDLQEMDIFAAERLPCQPWDSAGNPPESSDLIFPSYSVRRTGDNLLKDCCRLKLKVERNLDKYACFILVDYYSIVSICSSFNYNMSAFV